MPRGPHLHRSLHTGPLWQCSCKSLCLPNRAGERAVQTQWSHRQPSGTSRSLPWLWWRPPQGAGILSQISFAPCLQ